MRHGVLFGLLALLAVFLWSQLSQAAETGASSPARDAGMDVFQRLPWRSLGPYRGGRSLAVAGHPEQPLSFYFGATGGGLWKTDDAGTTWRPVTDGQLGSASVGAVAIAQSDPDVVYLGTGEGQLRASILLGDGVYRSDDGGSRWRHVGLSSGTVVTALAVHPKDPELVYAAVLGSPYQPGPTRGVYRSRDGGQNWQQVLFRSDVAGASDLVLDPSDPNVIYAALWEVYRRPWKLWSGGASSGLYKSTDGGDSWEPLHQRPGMPAGPLGKIAVTVSPVDPARVYANIEAEEGGLYRSDDAGETWQHINGDRDLWQRSFYFMKLVAHPRDRDTVYVLNFQLQKSADAGRSFTVVPTRHADVHDLWINPRDPSRMIVADDGSASVTLNGGESWTEQDVPTAQLYRLALTDDEPFHLCAAQQDSTTICVPSAARGSMEYSGERDHRGSYYVIGPGESGDVGVAREGPWFFSGGTNALSVFHRPSGRIEDRHPLPYLVMGQSAATMRERWNWTYPIELSPHRSKTIYVASQHVWKSVDLGISWERISADLTRAEMATLGDSGGPIRLDQDGPEVYATIVSLAPSPLTEGLLWAGSDDGLVYVTRDSGQRWTNVTPGSLPAHSRVVSIDPSPHDPAVALAVARRNEMGDNGFYLYRSGDYGQTWQRLGADSFPGEFAHAVRHDPEVAGILYLATERGVYLSLNDGESWAPLGQGLPSTPVFDLEVKGDELAIATHGRGFWLLSGLSVGRALKTSGGSGPSRQPLLMSPAASLPASTSANLFYWLPARASDVSVTVTGESGKPVRELLERAQLPAGLYQLEWDLRHEGAFTPERMIYESPSPATGPFVAPGAYRVVLEADGVVHTAPLRVVPASGAGRSEAEYREQESFALAVRDAVSLANRTFLRLEGLRARLMSASDDVNLEKRRGFVADVEALRERIYQVRNQSPKDKIAFPVQLNDRLAHLQGLLSMPGARLTPSLRMVYEGLAEELQQTVAAADALEQRSEQLLAKGRSLRAGA